MVTFQKIEDNFERVIYIRSRYSFEHQMPSSIRAYKLSAGGYFDFFSCQMCNSGHDGCLGNLEPKMAKSRMVTSAIGSIPKNGNLSHWFYTQKKFADDMVRTCALK